MQHPITKNHLLSLTLALLAALAIGLLRPNLALADGPITVTTTIDEFDAVANGTCSLREAIQSANQDSDFGGCTRGGAVTPPYTVIVPGGTYTLTIAGTNEDANINGDLDITTTLTISGAGAGSAIIDGNATERVFHIPTASAAVTITNVGITNGSETFAGGIWNYGTLTLNSSVVSGNSVTIAGGGIYNYGTLTLNNSTVSDNSANSAGGGFFNTSSTGGGILTLNNSTVSGNSANSAGGIYNSESPLTLNNSTVSGNSTKGSGGGIYNIGLFGTATLNLNHSTITTNTADSDNNGGDGGGIYNKAVGGTATVNFTNTIVAGNSDNSTPANNDCATSSGVQNSLGYNIIGNNDGCSVTAATGDNFGTTASPVDPGLLALADNGGGTQTHAFDTASPAHNQIPNGTNGCGTTYTTDQRGQPRPLEGSCDIGAYEGALTSTAGFDLAVNKTAASATVLPTTTITYTISVNNIDATNATGVVISDTLPLSVTFVSSTTNGGTYNPTTGVWNVGNVDAGTGVTMTLVVTANLVSGQTITNTAVLTASTPADTNTGNNSGSAGVTRYIYWFPLIFKNGSP